MPKRRSGWKFAERNESWPQGWLFLWRKVLFLAGLCYTGRNGDVAHLVERGIRIAEVVGSSPIVSTRKSLLQPLPKKFDKRLGIEDRKLVSKCSRASALFMELHCATSSSTGSTSAVMVRQILPLLFHQNQSTNA